MIRAKRKYLLLLLLLILLSIIITKKIYISIRCKDINYSLNYNLKNISEDSLINIKSKTLIFCDKDVAVYNIYGLRKNKPHKYVNLKCRFNKDTLGIWHIENYNNYNEQLK